MREAVQLNTEQFIYFLPLAYYLSVGPYLPVLNTIYEYKKAVKAVVLTTGYRFPPLQVFYRGDEPYRVQSPSPLVAKLKKSCKCACLPKSKLVEPVLIEAAILILNRTETFIVNQNIKRATGH